MADMVKLCLALEVDLNELLRGIDDDDLSSSGSTAAADKSRSGFPREGTDSPLWSSPDSVLPHPVRLG
jgi:hypothetical protein